MKLTFLRHSGFLLETGSCYLVFDCCRTEEEIRNALREGGRDESEGSGADALLPALSGEKPLIVFVSHSHYDHFDEAIFGLSEQYGRERVSYVLSSDIGEIDDIRERLSDRIHVMGPHETLALGPVLIRTLRSNDAGVAYLVQADGAYIYHAGDLQYWEWPGEPEADNRHYRDTYLEELETLSEYLQGKELFLSMLVLDERQEAAAYLGIDQFLRRIRTRYAVPMHSFGHYGINSAYAAHLEALKEKGDIPSGVRYLPVSHAGENFILDDYT